MGLLNVYVAEAPRLLICIGYTPRLWSLGFLIGVVVGYATGVALGWSKRFSYCGIPILKLIGPVLATAWIACTFFFPTTFAAAISSLRWRRGFP
jgi:NitT/TauT family transport system permease protein